MTIKLLSIGAILSVFITGCATNPMVASNFNETRDTVSVVLMKPDVEVKHDKVGSNDVRVDWTDQAETNLKSAIMAHFKASGENVSEFQTASISQNDLDQLLKLNEQVSSAMGQHAFNIGNTPFLGTLPHKKDDKTRLDYSLGDSIKPVHAATNADYAAFMTYRAVVESGGSFLTKVAIGTLTGYVPAGSDFRGTLVNLVDLKTGEVVWLNAKVAAGVFAGDARDADNATKTINAILDDGPFVEVTE